MNETRLQHLKAVYGIALACIALTILSSSFIMLYAIHRNADDSRVINLSGRQRMLSQRLTKCVLAMEHTTDGEEKMNRLKELSQSFTAWKTAHLGLQHGDENLGLPARQNSAEIARMFAEIEPFHAAMARTLDHLLEKAKEGRLDSDAVHATASMLLYNEVRFLKLMDQITFQFDAEAKKRIGSMQSLELVILGAGLLVLLLEFLLVFRPSIYELAVTMTSFKEAEAALRESKEKYRLILDHSSDLIWSLSPVGVFTYLSSSCKQMTGYEPSSLLGTSFQSLVHPDDLPTCLANLSEIIKTKEAARNQEYRVLHADGSWHWHIATVTPVLGPDGDVACFVAVARDITEQRRAEEELRESKQRLEIAMEGAEMGEWHWDCVENRRCFSDRTCSLLGIDPATFRGTADEFFTVMPPEDQKAVKAALARTLVQDMPYEAEYRAVWPDGSVHCIMARGKLYRDNVGRPRKLSGFLWDVTARKKTEDDLRHTVAALESANKALEEFSQVAESATRAKSEFLANMSHEIRTPMTAILGYADLLLSEDGIERNPEHCSEAIRTIKRNGEYLLGLINCILDLSKVESGKMEIQPVRCSPFALLAEVATLMRVRAAEKSVLLGVESVGLLPETVLTDPLRLRQVLVNLVGNAIKFTDQGKVRVAMRLVGDRGSQRLRFDVTDTGIGMNEEQMARLFQPFCQVDNSAARKFSGTGLGLAISKRLVEALGGTIEVHSIPGRGSTFSVAINPGPLDGIPLVAHAEAAVGPVSPSVTPAAGDATELHARVLLAEDGPDNQRLISFLLKKAGAAVVAVENGKLAVKEASLAREQGQPFDVILMDMQMPVMDGYTATRTLRKRGYTGPIMALTAHAMAEDRQRCLDAGCDDFATKPIDRQKLLGKVAHWADRGRTCDNSSKPTTQEGTASTPTAFAYSHLAADPDLGDLIEMFVQELPDRIKTLQTQAASRDWQELTRTAHQIKGAAGSYGFQAITPCAARLEAAAKDDRQEEEIRASLHELLDLCRHVRSGVPPMKDEHGSQPRRRAER